MDWASLIAKAVPLALPVFLLASFLVNTKKPGVGGGGGAEPCSSDTPKPPTQASGGGGSSRDKEGALTDKDMTAP